MFTTKKGLTMKSIRFSTKLLILQATVLLITSAAVAYAQAGGGFNMSWFTVDDGGGTSTGGSYTWSATIGQPDAGTLSNGRFTFVGGFWGVAASTPTPGPIIVGHVVWQGRLNQPNNLQRLPITLTLKSATTEINYPTQNTDASGFFTVTQGSVPDGSYVWRVKGPKYLASIGAVYLSGNSSTPLEIGLMRAGDANNDNVVNALDFNVLRGTFGKTFGQPGYDDRADFNGDLVVNAGDFNLLRGNFGLGGPPPIRMGGKRSE